MQGVQQVWHVDVIVAHVSLFYCLFVRHLVKSSVTRFYVRRCCLAHYREREQKSLAIVLLCVYYLKGPAGVGPEVEEALTVKEKCRESFVVEFETFQCERRF